MSSVKHQGPSPGQAYKIALARDAAQPAPGPAQVQQNDLVDGQIAAQNILSYLPGGVMFRVCQREPNGSHSTHCRQF
jgi:hypothetical protein